MGAYRDLPVNCPRCAIELTRADARDCWRCARCTGLLIGVAELIAELLVIAPDLLPDGGVRSITTLGRRTTEAPVTCAACAAPMEPVFLGGIDVDRCYHDEQIWFDADEHELVIQRAASQREARQRTGWLARLRAQFD